MKLDEAPDDRESDAETAMGAVERSVGLGEEIEYARQRRRVDSPAVVGDFEKRRIPVRAKPHADPPAGLGVLGRVLEEIRHDLREPHRIPLDRTGDEIRRDRAGGETSARLERLEALLRQLPQVDDLPPQVHLSGVETRDVEEIVDELELALLFFPLDPVLPGLAEITGTGGERLLAPFLRGVEPGQELGPLECELQHYKPFERAVLRVRAGRPGADSPDRTTVYVKLFGDERGAASHEVLSALSAVARRSSCLRVPEPLGYDAARRILVLKEAPGQTDLRAWVKCLARGQPLPAGVDVDRVRSCLALAAGTLRDLQRSGLRPRERRTFQEELARLRMRRALLPEGLARAQPGLLARSGELQRRLEGLAPAEERLVPAHGSYRHKQMIGDERGLTLVDWDGFCLANPALDAGTFLGLFVRPGGAPELDELSAGFRREILELQPEVGTHLALYEGLALARRVLSSLESQCRGKELSGDPCLLAAAAEERLDVFQAG